VWGQRLALSGRAASCDAQAGEGACEAEGQGVAGIGEGWAKEGRAGFCGSVAWTSALGERRDEAFLVKADQGLEPCVSDTLLCRTRRQAGFGRRKRPVVTVGRRKRPVVAG
jgi:hypothetical protein